MFDCGYAYLAINEYTETEVAWVGKAPGPYETIHSSLLLLLLCFLQHLSQGMSGGGKRGELPHRPKGRWGERKRENSWACWDLSIIVTFWLIGLPTQTNKAKKINLGSLFLHLQIICVNLCNFLKSSVSKILCLQNGATRCCPLESIFKTSYEKCLVVCLIFTSAVVLLNLFLTGESVLYKIILFLGCVPLAHAYSPQLHWTLRQTSRRHCLQSIFVLEKQRTLIVFPHSPIVIVSLCTVSKPHLLKNTHIPYFIYTLSILHFSSVL